MLDFLDFERCDFPFTHWVHPRFVSRDEVREINRSWPGAEDERWMHERRDYTQKSAIMFPRRLHEPAQALAEKLYSPASVKALAEMTGILDLLPDPWFLDGPLWPRVGGGLHEIHRNGLLKMHVDFAAHPSGLTRALNFLLYLNDDWRDEWGGALELGEGQKLIYPRGGLAVVFETTDTSWHGHPHPLACPEGKTRRSLALYYYRRAERQHTRTTTLYR